MCCSGRASRNDETLYLIMIYARGNVEETRNPMKYRRIRLLTLVAVLFALLVPTVAPAQPRWYGSAGAGYGNTKLTCDCGDPISINGPSLFFLIGIETLANEAYGLEVTTLTDQSAGEEVALYTLSAFGQYTNESRAFTRLSAGIGAIEVSEEGVPQTLKSSGLALQFTLGWDIGRLPNIAVSPSIGAQYRIRAAGDVGGAPVEVGAIRWVFGLAITGRTIIK